MPQLHYTGKYLQENPFDTWKPWKNSFDTWKPCTMWTFNRLSHVEESGKIYVKLYLCKFVSWNFALKPLTIFVKRLHPRYLASPKSAPGNCILILSLFYQMINWKLLTIFAKRFLPRCSTGSKSIRGNCILILSLF